MASSLKSKKSYDVFLSFRGTDLRNSFVSHLYRALNQNGIYTFQDSEELRKGDQISSTLMKAIEESCIAIIVFSEDYASSWWCLEETAKIMECREQKNLIVLPVFYKVDPKEVRGGRKSYRRALAKHESKFRKDLEKVKRWKKALLDAGNLSGWHLNDGDESKLTQEIVKQISSHLDRMTLHVAKHPIGIDSQVVKLKSMLNLESNDDVVMVGLWGQGGIGKTTLARALYNATIRQFEGSCFLADVRERSKDCNGLVTLQERLLKDILLLQQRLEVSNVNEGIHIIRHRLAHKKVLLILDDVDDLCQLDTLAGDGNWFGNGSRIIVTTRNKHWLTCHGIDQDHVYEVKALDYNQAHEVLSKHARQTHHIRKDLVDSALNYAEGLPLALEVLGSSLCGATEDLWESTLKKLSRNPDDKINNVLKVSYDGLHKNEKEIFLHIACFFKGWEIEYTKKVLNGCDLETVVGFDILIKRSLISIEARFLRMHDLIQLMGMDIVNQECQDDPGRRSRLWQYDDVVNIMSSEMGDCIVKAIVLNLPEPTEICINPDAFTKMRRLRLLILRNVRDSFQGPLCLPNDLRWFEWPGCAGRTPEFSAPEKLVGLDMGEGYVSGVVKQFKDFQQIKYINFNNCESLVRIPDLSCTPNLEELVLRNCKNMVEVHESIAHHEKLQLLSLAGCSQLSVFPNVLKSKSLRHLDLENCKNLERFPDIPHKLESLKFLYLQGTAIKELPASIENLVSLVKMNLSKCENLASLPSSIYKLQNVVELILWGCATLIRFPKYEDSADPSMKTGLSNLQTLNLEECNLSEVEFLENHSCFPLLSRLYLSGNSITGLPTSINKLDHLSTMGVANCYQLQDIPELPPFLEIFYATNCKSLAKIGDLISSRDFIHRGLTMIRKFTPNKFGRAYSISLPGGEMPEWFFPVEEGSISFWISKDLYDKFLGIAFCFVISKDVQKEQLENNIYLNVNGQKFPIGKFIFRNSDQETSPNLDHIWLQLYMPSYILRAADFGQSDGSLVQFSLTISGEIMKKWGLQIICKQLENDLKVMIQDNQLMDPALIHEVSPDLIDSEAESSHMHEDNLIETYPREDLQDCQMSDEEQSQIVPKRNHELLSLEACEPRPCGLMIRLAEMSMAVFTRCFCC